MRSGKHRGQKKQKRKGAYDKSGGITHDTAAFAFRTKDILKIRSRPRLEPGSDYHYLVRITGLEPARCLPLEPKSSASANSAISADYCSIITVYPASRQGEFHREPTKSLESKN